MPMGEFPMGGGTMGLDPVYKPDPPAPVVNPRATKFDPSIKQFVLVDANGNPVDVHPVDQIVAVRWTTQVGQSASSPLMGTRLRTLIQGAAPSRHQAIALAEFNRVVADLVSAGDIVVFGVGLTQDPLNGAEVYTPTYANLRDPNTNPRNPRLNAKSLPPLQQ
jgi:hypothetical protein